MLGRKIGMMRLYDGAGRARAVTVIEVGPNRVTQVRTTERDGYEAVQLGFSGARKRVNRPERGHLRRAGIDRDGRSYVLPVLARNSIGEGWTDGPVLVDDGGATLRVPAGQRVRAAECGVLRIEVKR